MSLLSLGDSVPERKRADFGGGARQSTPPMSPGSHSRPDATVSPPTSHLREARLLLKKPKSRDRPFRRKKGSLMFTEPCS